MPDFTKPGFYKTRDGRKAEILKCEKSRPKYPLIGLIGDELHTWRIDGRRFTFDEDSPSDLITPWTEPASGEFWYVIYCNLFGALTPRIYTSLEQANKVGAILSGEYSIMVPPTRVEWKEPEA